MRGAARVGGRNFKMPRDTGGGRSYDPFEPLFEDYDLPVAPRLEPINDDFSWSIGADPADPRDCARYPASPYCGEIPFRPGSPFGVEPEIKTNGCETCLYIYPVILWLMATPQVICYRDPNCDRKEVPPPRTNETPDDLDENVQPDKNTSPECAQQLSELNRYINENNRNSRRHETVYNRTVGKTPADQIGNPFTEVTEANHRLGIITTTSVVRLTYHGVIYGHYWWTGWDYYYDPDYLLGVGGVAGVGFSYKSFKRGGDACPPPPTIKPPPPARDDDDDREERKRRERDKRRDKKMCCNECKDASDNTAVLLREIKAIKKALGTGQFEKALNAAVGIGDGSVTAIVNLIAKRLGTSSYPIEVPESLLTGTGDGKVYKAESNAEYLFWLTKQLDALVGEFPIQIEVKDIDPLTKGDQKQMIQIPNIAEAIAEIYGLAAKGSINQEIEQSFLLRIATEVIAAKNGIAITQDYVKANAKFLGYRGNPVDRELQYNFDFSKIVLGQKDQEVKVDEILQTVKGYVKGWENKDKETAADFFMKLMFSAGIIKSVFFRNKKQMKDVIEKADEMLADRLKVEDQWKGFLKDVNNPNSSINKNQSEPTISDETKP